MTFRDLPIHRKLLILTLASSTTGLVLASGGFLAWDIVQLRRDIQQDINAQVAIVSDNSAAPLTFHDPRTATETLAVMRLRPHVTSACLYTADGAPFASYLRDPAARCAPRPPAGGDPGWRRYETVVPVLLTGSQVGTLSIDRDLDDLYDRLRVGAVAVGTLLLVAIAAALLIARRIQRNIVSPLLALADTARAISTGREDSMRVTAGANDEVGVVITAINAMLDRISQRNRELSRANAELAHEVVERRRVEEERTAALVRERDANRLKDEFLATLSHELRTPLNAVLGWTRVLRATGRPDASQQRALESIERNGRVQARLIEDLLEVSRIVTGKLRIQPRAVDLAAVIDRAIDVVQVAAAAKRIALTTQISVRPAMTSGDPDRLQQVIWNVLSNAVKFTTAGGAVTVRLTEQDGFHIEVADTGAGIEPRFLPHVFEAFRQADGSASREHGGLGLGLAIARQLVELHGGTIRVHSAGTGQGTTFTIDVPSTLQPADATERRRADSDLPASVDPALLRGVNVLIVDDQEDARALLEATLTQYGASVRGADSARTALDEIARDAPDVLLSDIGMPYEDGYQLIRQLRDLAAADGGGVPAIAVTAYASDGDRNKALAHGFQAHIAKPFEPEELVRLIATFARITEIGGS